MLNTVTYGTLGPTPLIIAHGLFGSARNWNVIAKDLSTQRPVIIVDMRNHGHSPWSDNHSYGEMADDLAEVANTQNGPVDVLGHSMGGKAAMVLAVNQPALVRRLIVADIAPVAYGHSQVHLIKAMRAVDLGRVVSRRDASDQLQAQVPQDTVRAFLLQSLDLAGDTPRWRLNLDALEDFMTQTIGFPDLSGQFDGRTLFLSGGASDYVQPDHLPRIRTLFSQATFQQIAGAGHWLHAEAPKPFAAAVRDFLS